MNPFVLVVGPTASGKSALGLELAKADGGAILNCDSLQAYQRLDIGSAKPSKLERASVPHFLFDILEPGTVLTAGDFRTRALEVLARELPERTVFGVGGSGFYIQALEKGMFDVPKPSPKAEAKIRALKPEDLYETLKIRDPEYAAELNANDHYRITRALIIIEDSGQTVTALKRAFKPKPFPYPLLKLGISPTREELLPRVEARARQMLEDGLIEEVRALVAEGFGEWPALKSVGYHECLKYLNGEISEANLLPLIVEKTMQLSKKQRTWFKRDPEIHWLDTHNPLGKARELIENFCYRRSR